MIKKAMCVLMLVCVGVLGIAPGLADRAEGDLYTFCPAMSTMLFNSVLVSFVEPSDSQALLIQVASDGLKDGNIVYSNPLQDTVFIFGGTASEYGTGTTAYIYCSLKSGSTLKNIPMIVWAACVQMKYFGSIEETRSGFLEWVNGNRKHGDVFTTPYFSAIYSEEPYVFCSLLLQKR